MADAFSLFTAVTRARLDAAGTRWFDNAIDAARRAGSLHTLQEWPRLLTDAGARVSVPRAPYRRILLGIVIIALVAAAGIAIFVNR